MFCLAEVIVVIAVLVTDGSDALHPSGQQLKVISIMWLQAYHITGNR